MRERLVVAFVGLTVVVLALFAIPRAYATADLVQDQDRREAARAASTVATVVQSRTAEGSPVTVDLLESLLEQGEAVTYTDADGNVVMAGSTDGGSGVTEPLPDGGTVVLSRSHRIVDDRVSEALVPLVLLVIALAAGAGLVGLVLAGRLARPFRELAGATEAFTGQGDARELPSYSVPEAERLRLALGGAVLRIRDHVERERSLAVDASHELRTPITALRLSLEDLTLWKQTPPDVSAELQRSIGELDRLTLAVDGLLDRDNEDALDLDLAALVRDGVKRWRTRAGLRGRDVRVSSTGVVAARLEVAGVLEVLEVLLEDAARRGEGAIGVDVRAVDSVLRVVVSDEGDRRVPTGQVHRGATGSAEPLAAAAQVAESLGGHLLVEDTQNHRVALVLPSAQGS
ncbi:histidine kinase dimerization/phospho-acceptor domain-containing protein [Aeromicrobium sp. CF4.19]|uniref:histidine kinase dimerization/phospho-acceptor domain-containing protein n=1 Tax=Aeromicrobium sp. CF4.19 TaxID=3373082 RepID=UPI003EE68FCE